MSYTFSALHSFVWSTDGGYPEGGGLAIDSEGNLYGTTSQGGAGKQGTLFKLDRSGKLTVLYAFTGGADGGMGGGFNPTPVLDGAGNLYGTAGQGGATGNGVVFKVDPRGHETVLYNFPGGAGGSEGFFSPTLLRDRVGNLYGTTYGGGDPNPYQPAYGCGLVYKVEPPAFSLGKPSAGKETVLYTFQGEADGCAPDPFGPLILDNKGNLYGVTADGFDVYKLDPAGQLTVLYQFTFSVDNNGGSPEFGLLRDDENNLYGTTVGFGQFGPGWGEVYKLDPASKLTILYAFTGGVDGGAPNGPLVRDTEGDLYGTTDFGGNSAGCGVVFKVDPSGKETILHTFSGGPDGCNPYAGLTTDEKGNFYGTALFGGTDGAGVVFKLARSPQLPW